MSQQIKIALLMAASLFMEILDGTIVTTALPKKKLRRPFTNQVLPLPYWSASISSLLLSLFPSAAGSPAGSVSGGSGSSRSFYSP